MATLTFTSKEEALRDGYKHLTNGLSQQHERWLLERFVADIRRAGKTPLLVRTQSGTVEVWQKAALEKS